MSNRVLTLLLAAMLVAVGLGVVVSSTLPAGYPVTIRYQLPLASTIQVLTDDQVELPAAEEWKQPITQGEEEQLPETVYFPLELNEASVEELLFIPKIGNITAQRIVQYRQLLGGYTDLEQLLEIKGIAKQTLEEISPYLYLTGDSWEKQ